jgi:hypothetical protein
MRGGHPRVRVDIMAYEKKVGSVAIKLQPGYEPCPRR